MDTPSPAAAAATSEPNSGNPPNPFYTQKQGGDWALFSREYATANRGRIKVRGFLNSGFLNGYVHRIDGAILWVMLSNNPDNCLPVVLPLAQMSKNNLRKHQPVAIQYTVSGRPTTSAANAFFAEAALRFAGSIENLALPLAAAFRKPQPTTAETITNPDDTKFEPYGSGVRLTGDPNRIFLAGIIAGIRTARFTRYDEAIGADVEVTPFSEVLLRQDDNPTNKIPVRIYRQLHQQIVANAKVGDPVFVEASLKITWQDVLDHDNLPVLLPSGAKKRVCTTFLQTEGLKVAQPIHIMGLPDEEKLPTWAKELRNTAHVRRRSTGSNDASVAGDASPKMSLASWLQLPTAVQRYDNLNSIFDDATGVRVTPQQAVAQLSSGDLSALRDVDTARRAAVAAAMAGSEVTV